MSPEDLQPYAAELPEPAAHMMQRDLDLFSKKECAGQAYSVAVSSPDAGRSAPLFTEAQVLTILADAYAHYAAQVLPRAGLAQPDAGAPGGSPSVEALEDAIRSGLSCTYHCTRVWSAWSVGTMSEDDFEPVDESDTPREIAECVWAIFQAAIAARDALVAGLEADLVEERNRIADMRTEHGQEVADLTARIATLEAEGAKSERRAIAYGDAVHTNIVAMRAAVVAWHRDGASDGMTWILNTIRGPGFLPSEDDIALGAQALFDKEMDAHEAFRAAHPGPAAPQHKEPT